MIVNNTWSEKQLALVLEKCLLHASTLPYPNRTEVKKNNNNYGDLCCPRKLGIYYVKNAR